MIHGFNKLTKERAEVYSKDDFIIIEGSINISADHHTGIKQFTAAQLLSDYGISDISEYVPISVLQTINSNDGFTTAYEGEIEGAIYPIAQVTPTSLRIILCKPLDPAQDIYYKVVLMKIA